MRVKSGTSPADYVATVHYGVPPADVYEAVAQPGGPNGWWTTSGDTATAEGGLMRLNWSGRDHIVFRLDRLDWPTAMTWTCVEQHDRNLAVPDEWVGTKLHFRFVEDRDGTLLEFTHEGLIPQLDCYDVCEGGWDFFLRRSVKLLAETGAGQPYVAEVDAA